MMSFSTERFQQSTFYKVATARYPFLKQVPVWGWGAGALLLLSLIVLMSLPVSSSAPLPGSQPTPGIPGSSTLASLQLGIGVLLKLGIVIGLMYLSLYLLKRWKGAMPGAVERRLSVVESLRLSPRQVIHLVKVGDQVLLIGATDQAMNLLTEVEPGMIEEKNEGSDPAPAVLTADFGTALNRMRRVL